MSFNVVLETLEIMSSISGRVSLKDLGDHLSNLSEYVRTAASPLVLMSLITPLTILDTSTGGPDGTPFAKDVLLRNVVAILVTADIVMAVMAVNGETKCAEVYLGGGDPWDGITNV